MHTKLIFIRNIQYILWFYIWTVFYIFRKCYELKASVLQYIIE